MSNKIPMYVVYNITTGKLVDMVPEGTKCWNYPICSKNETNWMSKEDYIKRYPNWREL